MSPSAIAVLVALLPQSGASTDMIVRPYAQLGQDGLTVSVTWHGRYGSRGWSVRYTDGSEVRTAAVHERPIVLPRVAAHTVFHAPLTRSEADARSRYEVLQNGRVIATGSVSGIKPPGRPFRFAAVGDVGRGTPGQKKIAYQIYRHLPDFQVILGDIVYPVGTIAEYRKFFFPIQNSTQAGPRHGAPLLSNTLTVPVIGNHDAMSRNRSRYPDGYAYELYWSPPGGGRNYTFRYGDSRWVVLDANTTTNWRSAAMRRWLDEALRQARAARWSFVAFHTSPYHSSRKHARDTNMRAIADLLTKHRVDVVFSGHIHNYQRSRPIRTVGGRIEVDTRFDGRTVTQAHGTLYVVSGAGGAELYDQRQADNPRTWNNFTAIFKKGHSFTLVDVTFNQLVLRQIDGDGREIDRIRLSK